MGNIMTVITLNGFLDLIHYKITEGTKHQWACFGDNAFWLTQLEEETSEYECNIVFDTINKTVYHVSMHDYDAGKSYIWINPAFRQAYIDESNSRGVEPFLAYENVTFIDLSSNPAEMFDVIRNKISESEEEND